MGSAKAWLAIVRVRIFIFRTHDMNALLELGRTMASMPPPPNVLQKSGQLPAPNDDASMASTPAPIDRTDRPPDPMDDPLFDVDDPQSFVARGGGGGAGDIATVVGEFSTASPPTTTAAPTSAPTTDPPTPTPAVPTRPEGSLFGMTKMQTLLAAVASIIACILLLIIAYAIPSSRAAPSVAAIGAGSLGAL